MAPEEIFQYLRERMDDEQWDALREALDGLFSEGVDRITYGDLMDLVECVVLTDDLTERLTSNG